MASMEKYNDEAVCNQLRHIRREINKSRNLDIDKSRSAKNYTLHPDRGMSDFDYYKQRLSQCYVYGRNDVNTAASWIVTCPKELTDGNTQRAFFEKTYEFIANRYGGENIINATVHQDEAGAPHIHIVFVPATKINHDRLHRKKKYPKRMDLYAEKVSANDVLNKRDLQTFHPELQKYLRKNGISANILLKAPGDGKTISLTTDQLKEYTRITGKTIEGPLTIRKYVEMQNELQTLTQKFDFAFSVVQDDTINLGKLEQERDALKEQVKELEQQIARKDINMSENNGKQNELQISEAKGVTGEIEHLAKNLAAEVENPTSSGTIDQSISEEKGKAEDIFKQVEKTAVTVGKSVSEGVEKIFSDTVDKVSKTVDIVQGV